jgi:hypothetical protein
VVRLIVGTLKEKQTSLRGVWNAMPEDGDDASFWNDRAFWRSFNAGGANIILMTGAIVLLEGA